MSRIKVGISGAEKSVYQKKSRYIKVATESMRKQVIEMLNRVISEIDL